MASNSVAGVAAETFSVAVTPSARNRLPPTDDLTTSKAHHRKNEKGFQNPWDSWVDLGLDGIAKGIISYRFKHGLLGPSTKEPDINSVVTPIFPVIRSISSTEFRATWLGHSCYYVEFPGGLRVLFDPVFSQRCSPVQFIGPKRYTRLPCEISEIPAIDIVCISHNHYDHLDHGTIQQIKKLHPDTWYFVPLGNKPWFESLGITNCVELDWWESRDITLTSTEPSLGSKTDPGTSPKSKPPVHMERTTATIEFLPCQHTSNRGLKDRSATLWGSWMVESYGKKLYFAGDTGYRTVPKESEGKDDYGEEYANLPVCPAFKQIGELRGPFDLGLLPIGAYVPRWVMSPMHSSPMDAVNIFIETRCKRALGMHWGTFVLTDEPVLEPASKLTEALAAKKISEKGVFDVVDIGESILV